MSKFLTKFLVAFLQTFAFCVCQHPEFGNELSNGEQRYFQPKSNHLIQHDARLRRTKFYDTHKHYTIYYIPKTPKIITKLKDMKVLRDQQAIFICSSVGNPPPIIDWQVDEKRELPKRYTVEKAPPRKSILRLDPVSVSDDRSRITCRASNGMGTVFSYASIRVYKKKEEIPPGFPFLVSRSSVIVNEKNSRVLLECQVNGNPKPEILWLKDNIPLDLENPRIKLLKNGGLEINRTLEEDEGGYQCLASNYHGTIISSVIRLMIRENIEDTYQLIMKNVSYFAPQFVSVPNDQVVSPGSSLTLKCRALGNPMPSVFWKCGQTILQPHSYNSSLQKAEANVILSDLSESITCTCIAKNPKESISRSIQVTIQEPSVTPPNIKVSQITATSCVVSWNQKAFREDQLKYQVFIMKTSDLQSGKNIKSNVILYSKRKDSEMNINQKIDNLLPYTNYTGWLEFYNHQGEAVKSNLVTFTTLELPPSSAPRNVELSAISNGALIVTWDPPEIPNGIITSYSIYYTQYRTISLSLWDKYNVKVISSHTPKQQTILSHLLNNVTYYVSISAHNGAGSGPVSELQAILVRAGVVQGPKNLRAIAKSSTEIQLFWDPIVSKPHTNILNYQLMYRPKSALNERIHRTWTYSPNKNSILVDNLKQNTTYEFHLSADTASASGMASIVECTTSNRAFEEPINIIVQVLNSTTVDVLWKTTPEMRKQVIHYRIQCRSLVSNEVMVDVFVKNSTITMKHQTEFAHHMFTHLTPNTQYQIYLNTITRHGSGSIFKSDLFKTWPKKLPKPDYLHLRLACSIEHPCVKLEWKTDLKDEKNIKGYRIRYYPLIENADMKFKVVEKNVTVTKFETSSLNYYQGFRFEFKVAAFNEYEVGEESSDQIYILEGTPLVSPTGFKLKSTSQNSPTSISFIWDKLPQHALNGRFDHYQLMCFIVGQENQTRTFYKTKTESITVNNLLENANYACKVRVWIQKSSGLWSDPISFKTKDAHLLPPEAIRFIRLSHSTGLITWKWKLDFPLYYSHFIIYYANEKNNSNQKIWLVETTKSAFTKYMLTSLNATISYVLRVSSVSNRGIEGPQSGIVKEVSLTPKSWEAKFVNQFSCAADSSSSIQLRWSADFNNQELTHFRINFTGVTTFQMETKTVSKMRDEQEQSALVSDQNKYYTHQILNLKPNTMYSIDIEPIFSSTSTMIGTRNHTICTTFKGIPGVIEIPVLSNIDKSTNQIELLLQRPNMENGTIDVFFVLIKIEERLLKNRRKRAVDEFLFEDVMKDNLYNEMNRTNIYAALSLKNDVIFPLSTPNKVYHKILIGSGETKGSFQNRKLQPTLYYSVRVMACIVIRESTFKKLQCQSSPWSNQINIKTTIPPKRNENPLLKSKSKNSYKHSSKDPGAFTTATVVVLLGVVILSVLGMLICLFVKRRKSLRSKLGNSYGSHSNRLCKEKSICMEHLLKEPLVDSAFRISTSGSLRFKNHTNNYLDLNKIQLSSTPDLLVRSSVTQPHSSLVQFHGQHLTNRHFDYAPIPIDALTEHVKLLKENEGRLFNKEYESIEPGQQFTWNNSNVEVNRLKNRYANVIAYDHSRVVLQPLLAQKNSTETSVILGSDYINANYISGYLNPNSYIATQGPLAETIGDFWRMMWEQNSSVIVMMTRLEERDRTKCDQYWPIGGKGSIATYSYVNVTIVDITELAYYTIRRFHIQKANENSNVREVYQLQFTAWPDHGVPNHPAPLLMFLRRVHSEIRRNSGPIVVHCSAGVGRTGAFIVIDYMLERLRYENTIDVYNYVTTIRAQRNYMVQTEDQYIFIYETLLEAVQCGNTEVPVSELPHHIEKLNQIEITHKTVDGIQMTGLQMEFENLILSSEGFLQGIKFNNNNNNNNNSHCSTPSTSHGNVVMNYQPLTYETATQIVNQAKNRIMQILPPDFSRVNICPIRGVEGSDYINASWIDGYKSRKAYIAAQSPLQETCEDFWRTMWEHNSSIIVMLTHLKENNRERCYQYWPNLKSSRYQFFIVDPIAEYNMTTYLIREFKLTDTRDSQSKVIRQFQFTEWQDSESIPLSTQVFLDLIYQVHKTKVQLGQDGPITVHCSAGTGRTGIFLALSNIIERMTNESVIDLFQTVKLLRWQRPALIQTEDQYHFCYVAALEYLKIFEQMRFDL